VDDGPQVGRHYERKLLLLTVRWGSVLAFLERAFEIADPFAQAFAEVGELARSEDEQGDDQKNQKLRHSKFTEHKILPNDCVP